MADKLGIGNLKNLVDVAMSIPKQIADSSADGWQWTDAFSFTDEAFAVVRVGKTWKEIAAEIKDLDETERQELYTYFKEKFDIPDDQLEVWIEDAIEWAVITIKQIERFKALKK